ncbi:MAG TPA: GNAT family N-acetyltransferase [Parvularculaceae bacterium]|nr:GNAT family N-acetyltransferase [Parvularculaceae bacterium]
MDAPVIETKRLILRGRTLADFPAYQAMWADPRVSRYTTLTPLSEEDAWTKFARMAGFWELCGYGFWIVEEKRTGRFLGEVGLADFKRNIDPPLTGKPEFGWIIIADAHGQGYATEAARASLGWADEKFPGATACCIIDPENAVSIRVAEKCGFREVARTTYKDHAINIYDRKTE